MRLGVVLLTTGTRPTELAAAIMSVRHQRGVTPRIVVIANTADEALADRVADSVGEGVVVIRPGDNVGIPAGRNRGVAELVDTDAVAFVDDDAVLRDRDVLAQAAAALATDPQLAVVSMRLIDPDTGKTARRHVPRIVVGNPARSSWTTTFLGGACVVRRSAYLEVGGLPDEFFYAHEETSLAWRLIDAGWKIRYRGDLKVEHPVQPPTRHGDYHHLSMRNRVLLARMHLPAVVGAAYVTVWFVLSLLRGSGGRRSIVDGLRAGLRQEVARHVVHWRTIWRLTRYGRPPVI